MRHSLYKYFSERRWAEAFLDGEVLFRSLAYFRDYEDENVRKDKGEGSSIYKPAEGLLVTNQTQGKTFTLPGYAFEATANQEEIFRRLVIRDASLEFSSWPRATWHVHLFPGRGSPWSVRGLAQA